MTGDLGVRAIILAGGRGRRLEPYTSVLPKPLMPVGHRAIVEIIVDRLVASGVADITLCVGYLAHLIEALLYEPPLNRATHICPRAVATRHRRPASARGADWTEPFDR